MASSTIVTAGLGLLFWILASRIYTDDSNFGVGATAVSTMMMLADLACVGMRTGLVKFVPSLGLRRGRIVSRAYLIAMAVATTVAAVFLLGLSLWAPRLGALTETVLVAVFFVAATACWSVFILEDSVLTGIRKTVWVPVENAIFGLAKIALLWPMSLLSPDLGVFWAWALPVFPIVIGVNTLIARQFRKAAESESVVAEDATDAAGDERLGLRPLLSYSSADWLASVARLAATGIGPLLVLGILGQAEAGYFNIGWLIAYTTYLLSINVSDAMLAESSFDRGDLNGNSRQALLLSLALTVPIVIVGSLAAPYILRIFGQSFADNATVLLRFLLLAAIPNVAYQIFLGRLRSQGRMRAVIALEATLAAVVLAVATLALRTQGLGGIGLAWLIAFGLLGLLAVLVETQWWWASRLDTSFVRSVGRRVDRLRRDSVPDQSNAHLQLALTDANIVPSGPPSWGSVADDLRRARVADTEAVHDVYLATTATGLVGLENLHSTMTDLRAVGRDTNHGLLLPTVGPVTATAAGDHVVLSSPSGRSGSDHLTSSRNGTAAAITLIAQIQDTIVDLHHKTGERRTATELELQAWIDQPLERIRSNGRATQSELDNIAEILRAELSDHELDIAQIHGALLPTNVIVDDAGRPVALRGWRTTTTAPRQIDVATLALAAEAVVEGEELGVVVERSLRSSEPGPVLATVQDEFEPLSTRAVVLLAWLLLVGRDRPSGSAVLPNLFWASRNVQPVVAAVAEATERR